MLYEDLIALGVTVKLASATTALLLLLGTPLAWWLARGSSRWRVIVEAVVALPLILPPTVLGFYLLLALSPTGPLGALAHVVGYGPLAFSFTGLLIGSVCYSLPFVVQPLHTAFSTINIKQLEIAATLGAGPRDRFLSVIFPMSRAGFLSAVVMGFAHTVGEFGVVLMIGGNIPGATQVVSIAIYDHVEVLDYGRAHVLAGFLLAISFTLLVLVYALNRRWRVGS